MRRNFAHILSKEAGNLSCTDDECYLYNNFQKLLQEISYISTFKCFIEKLMAFLKSIFKELQNEPKDDYARVATVKNILNISYNYVLPTT